MTMNEISGKENVVIVFQKQYHVFVINTKLIKAVKLPSFRLELLAHSLSQSQSKQ